MSAPAAARQFARFVVTGACATLLHAAVFLAAVELLGWPPVAATVPAFLAALLASYRMNARWTFRASPDRRARLPRYGAVALTGLVLNVLITYGVVDVLGAGYGLALALVLALVPAAVFLANRSWTFAPVRARAGMESGL